MASHARSKGCHSCRRMKVKCDEHKPHCQRCQKVGRECPGYRASSDVIFRSMNETAEESSRRRSSKPKSKAGAVVIRTSDFEDQLTDSPSSLGLAKTSWRRKINSIDQPVSTDWNQQAQCAFLYDYVIRGVKDGRGGYLDFLPNLYAEHSDKQYFAEALAAVSMASFANRTSMDHLAHRARVSYGRTLSLVNEALSDPAEVKDDCLLTSLFLLSTYEDISGDKSTLHEFHASGQMELLRLRGSQQFITSCGRNLYRLIKARQRLRDLNQCCEPSLGVNRELELFGPAPHAAKLAIMLAQVGKLCSDVRRRSNTELQTSGWGDLALELQQGLKYWVDYSPVLLHYWSLSPTASSSKPKSPASGLEFNEIFVFKHIQIAVGWNLLWCARIFLLQAMLQYRYTLSAEHANQSPLPPEAEIHGSLRETVDKVCATVPFCMGEIDSQGALNTQSRPQAIGAYFLVWVLYVASSVTCLSPARETWILDRMLHISNVMGIRQALILRQKRELERAERSKHPVIVSP